MNPFLGYSLIDQQAKPPVKVEVARLRFLLKTSLLLRCLVVVPVLATV